MSLKVENINPFLSASSELLKQMCNIEVEKRPLYVKEGVVRLKNITITIGVTGDIKGNFIINLDKEAAMDIASKMMGGYEVTELNELTTSAVSELCNMIAGHSGIYFSNEHKNIDITPPAIYINSGDSQMNYKTKTLCVPLVFSNGHIMELDVSIM